MKSRWSNTIILLAGMVAAVELKAETQFQDSQRRFTIAVPTGWTPAASEAGVQLSRGNAIATVFVMENQSLPSRDLASQVADQFLRAWKDAKGVASPDASIGGQAAATSVVVGIHPNGVSTFAAIFVIRAGSQALVLVETAPMSEYQKMSVEMDRISSSFTPQPGSVAPSEVSVPRVQTATAHAQAPLGASGSSNSNYEAKDHSLSLQVPAGWKASQQEAAGTVFQVLEHEGGPEKILVNTGQATANSLQELARQAMQVVPQLLPGLQPSGTPTALQIGGSPAMEISYGGIAQGEEVTWWQQVMLQNGRFISVLGGGKSQQSQMVRQQCQTIAATVKLGKVTENQDLTRAILGHWNYYKASRAGTSIAGSVTKEITFYPNKRFQYKAATYIPNMHSDVNPVTEYTGTYRIEGSTLYYQPDRSVPGSFQIQFVSGGQALNIGGELFIR